MFYADAGVPFNGGNTSDSFQGSRLHAHIQLEKEELDVEKGISEIIEVQVNLVKFILMAFVFTKFFFFY